MYSCKAVDRERLELAMPPLVISVESLQPPLIDITVRVHVVARPLALKI